MKTIKRIIMILGMLAIAAFPAAAQEKPIDLVLDGVVIQSDTDPVIVNNRTMIPARALFEAAGYQVEWLPASRQVSIDSNQNGILLTLDKEAVQVNGKTMIFEIAPHIINNRTMIPVRFTAEALGFTVDWDAPNRRVLVTSPVVEIPEEKPIHIIGLTVKETESGYRVAITADGKITGYKRLAVPNPDRYVIDILNATNRMTVDAIPSAQNNEAFTQVRVGQFTTDSVRVVADLKQTLVPVVSLSRDEKTLYADFTVGKGTEEIPLVDGLPVLSELAQDKLVVIDAGHGGKQPGAIGKDGTTKLYEKDINLKVARRVNELLQEAGVRTYMIREGDETINTDERPGIANEIGADLYLCIHNNSYASIPSVNGTETMWFDGNKNTGETYGITSKRLAQIAQERMLKELGLKDRGLVEYPALYVLKDTKMPAILIEGAFLSNPENLAFMLTDEFAEGYARAAAWTVIQGLNESVK